MKEFCCALLLRLFLFVCVRLCMCLFAPFCHLTSLPVPAFVYVSLSVSVLSFVASGDGCCALPMAPAGYSLSDGIVSTEGLSHSQRLLGCKACRHESPAPPAPQKLEPSKAKGMRSSSFGSGRGEARLFITTSPASKRWRRTRLSVETVLSEGLWHTCATENLRSKLKYAELPEAPTPVLSSQPEAK